MTEPVDIYETIRNAPSRVNGIKDFKCQGCGHSYNQKDAPYNRLGETRCPKCRSDRKLWTFLLRYGRY